MEIINAFKVKHSFACMHFGYPVKNRINMSLISKGGINSTWSAAAMNMTLYSLVTQILGYIHLTL